MAIPKWFDKELEGKESSVKEKANAQEKAFAKRTKDIGGSRQPASGAIWCHKGDVSIGSVALGDNKQTKHKSFSITGQMWEKIKREATDSKKEIPFLQIEMNECEPLIVLSENDFIMLIEKYIGG